MIRTSTDARTRAQKYADSRWWGDSWPHVASTGVKVVGYAIHRPEFDLDRSSIYSVSILHRDGTTRTRFICVSREYVYECTGEEFSPRVPKTWRHELAERSA